MEILSQQSREILISPNTELTLLWSDAIFTKGPTTMMHASLNVKAVATMGVGDPLHGAFTLGLAQEMKLRTIVREHAQRQP